MKNVNADTSPDQDSFRIYSLNERAITIEFGAVISEHVWQQVNSFDRLVQQHPFIGFYTSVPAYTTLTVFYNPLLVYQSADMPGVDCFDKVSTYLTKLHRHKKDSQLLTGDKITIPVCYEEHFGPDLNEVAALNNLTVADVIVLHTAVIYKVYMIGFVPGFAYLGGMDSRLATPRKSSPRKHVEAGTVGIAGAQTGIYPLQTPGGWQIIGQTPLRLFDVKRHQPSLLKAGDEVVFKPISIDEFNDLSRQGV